MNYEEFLQRKLHLEGNHGFQPIEVHPFLKDFQKYIVEHAIRKGRSSIFADCGLGKTPMQLSWADNIVRKTNKNVLVLTPLAVGPQTIQESEKFGIETHRSQDGKIAGKITVTNYQRLHYFNPDDFIGVVCDESSILKNFDGKTKAIITEFMRRMPYRLLCTATAAPNDYIELGTSSEALGYLGYTDMLTRFFKNQQGSIGVNRYHGKMAEWRFKHHAEIPFWRWVCSWAIALRKPSDLGFDDDGFILPELKENSIIIKNSKPLPGFLFTQVAKGLQEERKELKITVKERCERAAEISENHFSSVIWCNLNEEGKLLKTIIPGSIEISGSDSDDKKEDVFLAFKNGQINKLITKAKIAGFGLNWEHCNHTIFFPTHSYEQYYQAIRRLWRFGQKRQVVADVITTEGGRAALDNMHRKSLQAAEMFSKIVELMNNSLSINRKSEYKTQEVMPSWL